MNTETSPSNLVVLIEDDRSLRASMRQWLELSGFSVLDFERAEPALARMDAGFPGVALSDVKMPGMDGLAFQRIVRVKDPDIPVVLMTAHGDISMAVEAMRHGAYDFVEKPFDDKRLLDILNRAMEKRRLVLENRQLRIDLAASQGLDARLVGSSASMRAFKRELLNIAPTVANVLILGETGTGKEVAARCLHDLSPRRQKPLIVVDCASIPLGLAESELFGHERGSFTGAERQSTGKLEAASGGTLFLDEINSLHLDVQSKFLRALQEKAVTPVGSHVPRPVDFRLVCAANCNLQEAIRKGTFREDLYYRINTVELSIPPLREHKEDIPLLFSMFLERSASTYGRDIPDPGRAVTAALMAHNWPGNIRELKNFAERFVLLGESASAMLSIGADEPGTAEVPLCDQVELFERQIIKDALKRHKGDIRSVMADLCLPRRTLNEKMAKYGLKRSEVC